MDEQLFRRILAGYGLRPQRLLASGAGYRNRAQPALLEDGRTVNLVVYKRESGILARIRNANRMSDWLAASGLPTRRTEDRRVAALESRAGTRYGMLYSYLPGQTIPWEAYTMKHLKLLGAVMSTMHAALLPLDRGTLSSVADEYRALLEKMQKYLAEPGVQRALRRKLGLWAAPDFARLGQLLDICAQPPGQQPLHMDFVRGNILFEAEPELRISGILDFEKTAWGHPALDIARTLAFLLVDCKYKPEGKVRKYFLESGYNKHGPIRFNQPRLLEALLDLFLLHDFYKFLRHNPYEYLPHNEHFVRTRDLLVRRGSIAIC